MSVFSLLPNAGSSLTPPISVSIFPESVSPRATAVSRAAFIRLTSLSSARPLSHTIVTLVFVTVPTVIVSDFSSGVRRVLRSSAIEVSPSSVKPIFGPRTVTSLSGSCGDRFSGADALIRQHRAPNTASACPSSRPFSASSAELTGLTENACTQAVKSPSKPLCSIIGFITLEDRYSRSASPRI